MKIKVNGYDRWVLGFAFFMCLFSDHLFVLVIQILQYSPYLFVIITVSKVLSCQFLQFCLLSQFIPVFFVHVDLSPLDVLVFSFWFIVPACFG